jgi:hypothetical protein
MPSLRVRPLTLGLLPRVLGVFQVIGEDYEHRGALRGTPGGAYPQPEPNALSCPVAPQAAQS